MGRTGSGSGLRLPFIFLMAAIIPACGGSSNSKLPATLPNPPTGLVATAFTTARIDLVWVDASDNEFEFRIERGDALAGPYLQIAVVPMNTQAYTDLGLLANKQYFYRITAWNSLGNSPIAGPANATTNALTWSTAPMTGGPTVLRGNHSAIYDSLGRRMIVFGGLDDSLNVMSDVWSLDLNTLAFAANPWTPEVTGGITDPPLFGHSAIYDTANNRMIVFGGNDSGFALQNTVYVLNLATMAWSQPAVTGTAPSARALHTAIYEAASQSMVVSGGNDGIDELSDVHVLSLPVNPPFVWSTPVLGAGPIKRSQHAAIPDPLRSRMVIFGGFDQDLAVDGSVLSNESWTLALGGTATWNQLLFSGTPTFRRGHTGVYDAANQRMLIFGGDTTTTPTLTNELWGLRLDVTPTWSILPFPGGPAARFGHSAVYDSGFNRMIIFSGNDASTIAGYNDVWVIRL